MFAPKAFAVRDENILRKTISSHPLATLLINGDQGPLSAYAPMVFGTICPNDTSASTLIGHVARANPFWSVADQAPALAIFAGPDGYISPSYYPSKTDHGRVVPTWNYIRVEARGLIELETNPNNLRPYVEALTRAMETNRPNVWQVSDAPDDYIETLLKGIIGIKMTLTSLEGSYKLSQNKDEKDRLGVSSGLAEDNHPTLADMVNPPINRA